MPKTTGIVAAIMFLALNAWAVPAGQQLPGGSGWQALSETGKRPCVFAVSSNGEKLTDCYNDCWEWEPNPYGTGGSYQKADGSDSVCFNTGVDPHTYNTQQGDHGFILQ